MSRHYADIDGTRRFVGLTCDDCGAFWPPAEPPAGLHVAAGWTKQRVESGQPRIVEDYYYCEVCSAKRGIDLIIAAENEA
jgi:hypothetical protein